MRIRVTVVTVINNIVMDSLSGVPATFEGSYMPSPGELLKKPDRYKTLNPEGAAEVRIGLEEKLSGPANTYSSVTVMVQVTARCDQSSAAVKHALDVVHTECVQALERYIEPAQKLLIAHLGPR